MLFLYTQDQNFSKLSIEKLLPEAERSKYRDPQSDIVRGEGGAGSLNRGLHKNPFSQSSGNFTEQEAEKLLDRGQGNRALQIN